LTRLVLALAAFSLAGCATAPEPAAAPAPLPPVRDLTALLPAEGRMAASVVPDHLLGQPKMPGGTVGDYQTGGKKYQLFVIEADSVQAAAFLLVDMKSALQNPEYIAHMGGYFGGYFGTGATGPVYVFAKLRYLAGVAGLSQDEADPIARVLAARLK